MQRNQRSNCQHPLDHWKTREFHKISFASLTMSNLWLCGPQQTLDNSERDGNTRPPNLFLRNLYAGQEATVRTGHGTADWFQIRKGVCQGCILSLCLFNLYAEMLGWMKHKLASRLLGEISVSSDMQMTPHPYSRRWRTKEPLDESESGEWKSWLKSQHSEN